MRYIIIILFFGLLVTLFFIVKNEYVQNKNATVKIINQKSSLIKCELKNEIIDMKKLDSERQCYYECGKDDIVEQNFVMER